MSEHESESKQKAIIAARLTEIEETIKPYTFLNPQLEKENPNQDLIGDASFILGLIHGAKNKVYKLSPKNLDQLVADIERRLADLVTKHQNRIIKD